VVEILQLNDNYLEEQECVICCDALRETVFYPCGHQLLCHPCSQRFLKEARHQLCPVCRNRVNDSIRVYK